MKFGAVADSPDHAVMACDFSKARITIFDAFIEARKRFGGGTAILVDGDERVLSYDQILLSSLALGHALKKGTERGESVGIMLPTGAGAVLAFLAVSAYGRVPAMLNFTSGAASLRSALRTAQVKRVVTARRFIELGKLEGIVAELQHAADIVYLEDVRETLGIADKLAAAIGRYAPSLVKVQSPHQSPAVILFTSGTEGEPKGVALSHFNILANVLQMQSHVALSTDDVFFNPLPTFHSMGLTGGAILPLLTGMKVVLHPTPLQPREILSRIRATRATILCSTDTFISQYARTGREGDLDSLRFAVCGAEKVRDETRALLRQKYGVEVMEGYGVTEASPVVALGQIGVARPGIVGPLMQGMEARLEPVDGVTDAGRLFLRGPNIMLGYIKPDQPGLIHPPKDGWHDTGDVVSIAEDGTIAFKGRLKRFAKIGGETVSLTTVESCASALWPDYSHAAVAIPDGRKGEQIVLVTTCPDAARSDFVAWVHDNGVQELATPRHFLVVDEIPVMGTGKTNYTKVQKTVCDSGIGVAE